MARHVFQPTVFHNTIGLGHPVHSVEDGDTVVTQTIDAWGLTQRTNRSQLGQIRSPGRFL